MSHDKPYPHQWYGLDFKYTKEFMLGVVSTGVQYVVSPFTETN